MTLGNRWLALTEKMKRHQVLSIGGAATSNNTHTMTHSVLKTAYKLYSMAETVYKTSSNQDKNLKKSDEDPKSYKEAVVTIVDLDTLCQLGDDSLDDKITNNLSESEIDEQGQVRPSSQSVLFHFVAHKMSVMNQNLAGNKNEEEKRREMQVKDGANSQDLHVANMAFDSSGTMIVTADNFGHVFNVFKLHASITMNKKSKVEHLYW